MLIPYLNRLMKKQDLSAADYHVIIEQILQGAAPEQIAAFLVLLHAKTETPQELFFLTQAMQAHMIAVPAPSDSLLDIMGTGGDGANTMNISTAAALLIASLGVPVAKHGGRAVSSQSGSADLIEALGIPIPTSATEATKQLKTHQFTFLFAPQFNPAMQAIRPIRKALGLRTTFNLLGPLLNPAKPAYYVLGVSEPYLLDTFADVLQLFPIQRALIIHGNGLDEISCVGKTDAILVTPNEKKRYQIDPKHYGLSYCSVEDLRGGNASYNCKLLQRVLTGEKSAITDTILLNTAVALHLVNHVPSIEAGLKLATDAIAEGKSYAFLKKLQETVTYA